MCVKRGAHTVSHWDGDGTKSNEINYQPPMTEQETECTATAPDIQNRVEDRYSSASVSARPDSSIIAGMIPEAIGVIRGNDRDTSTCA